MTENIPIAGHSSSTLSMFQSLSVPVFFTDEHSLIRYVNPAMQQFLGYRPSEILHFPTAIFFEKIQSSLLDQQHTAKKPVNGLKKSISSELYYAIPKKTKRIPVHIYWNAFSVGDYSGKIGFLLSDENRLEERIRMERMYDELEKKIEDRTRELSRTLQVLGLLNEKLETTLSNQKAILDNAHVMLFLMSKRGIIRFFNPEAERLTGFKEGELVNKFTPLIFLKVENAEHCICKQLQISDDENEFDRIKRAVNDNQIIERECVISRKSGESLSVSLTITPILDSRNLLKGYLGVAMDITERKKAEFNLLQSLQKEKQLSELKSRFVSMASHEFRTPLSTILSSTYLIGKYQQTEEQPKRDRHLSRIISAVNNLTAILNEFLSVGKIEEGKINIQYTEFDIQKVINQATEDMQFLLREGQHFRYEHQGESNVYLDVHLFKNILNNLFSNAIKFSPECTDIVVKTSVQDNIFELSVRDRGIGIHPDDQIHLMDRFFRGSNAAHIQGTGLGLHIVSKYVEQMNGSISFNSEPGVGTEFLIHFNTNKINRYEENSLD